MQVSSPACTELETVVMDWLGKMLGLPDAFLSGEGEGNGGGVIQVGRASEGGGKMLGLPDACLSGEGEGNDGDVIQVGRACPVDIKTKHIYYS